jgi:hypothetical protein
MHGALYTPQKMPKQIQGYDLLLTAVIGQQV